MTKEIKDVINKILSYDIENPKLFGSLIADVIFDKQTAALLIDNDSHCFLLHSSELKFSELYQTITKLLSVLSYLEANGLIYRQCDDCRDELTVFYEGSNDLKQLTGGRSYRLGNGYNLQKEKDKYQVTTSDNKTVLPECHNMSALYKEISYYMKSFIYPASGLSAYVDHNYLSDNDYQSKKSLCVSRLSLWTAVVVACLSPIISLLLGNKWGVTEIKEDQYEQFMKRTAITDTIIIDRRDTIVEFVHDTIYTKK